MLKVQDLPINILPHEGPPMPVYPLYLDTSWRPYDDDQGKGGKKGSSKGSSKKSSKKAPSKKGSKKK